MKDQRLEAKYRPTSWDQYVGNENIVEQLKNIEAKGFYQMPCILLYGPPGTGKSLAIEILARNLKKKTKHLIFDKLNASDKRKLNDIRDLKDIAEQSNPRIIFMDEFDSVLKPAQAALRVPMEDKIYDNTRWCISCNNPRKIISAIKSRCAVFGFENHSVETIGYFLTSILDAEEIEHDFHDPDFQVALYELIESRNYDLRGCINQLSAIITEDGKLTLQGVVRRIPVDEVKKIVETAYDGDLKSAKTMLDDILVQKNHNFRNILDIWYDYINKIENEEHARRIYMAFSEYSDRCERGHVARHHLTPFLSFVSLASSINTGSD